MTEHQARRSAVADQADARAAAIRLAPQRPIDLQGPGGIALKLSGGPKVAAVNRGNRAGACGHRRDRLEADRRVLRMDDIEPHLAHVDAQRVDVPVAATRRTAHDVSVLDACGDGRPGDGRRLRNRRHRKNDRDQAAEGEACATVFAMS
jgi:hypothetical protein